MIIDKIENFEIYFQTPILKQVFEDLKKYTLATPNGTYRTHDNYYFKVMSYDTKLESNIIESHEKEVDVQILLSGNEHIKIYDVLDVEVTKPYDKSTDCQFYRNTGRAISQVNLKPGYMGVFFPDDIHHPQFAVNNKIEKLKKIVIKIDEKLFS